MEEINLEVIKQHFKQTDKSIEDLHDEVNNLKGKVETTLLEMESLKSLKSTLNTLNIELSKLTDLLRNDYVSKELCDKNTCLQNNTITILRDKVRDLESESRHLKWLIYGALIAAVLKVIFIQ